jgi:hypothetical protein
MKSGSAYFGLKAGHVLAQGGPSWVIFPQHGKGLYTCSLLYAKLAHAHAGLSVNADTGAAAGSFASASAFAANGVYT